MMASGYPTGSYTTVADTDWHRVDEYIEAAEEEQPEAESEPLSFDRPTDERCKEQLPRDEPWKPPKAA